MKQFFRGFGYAYKGLVAGFSSERNMKLHVLAAILVITGGYYYHVSVSEWLALLICIGGVFAAELLNTAIEKLTDLVSPAHHPQAGAVKDLAAGAVLVVALTSAVVGSIIFLPRLF